MKMKNVFICVPATPGRGIVTELVELLLLFKDKVGAIKIFSREDRKTSRNILRLVFLKSSYEFMLTIDSDVIPPYKPLISMVTQGIKNKRIFISATVPGFRGKKPYWMAFKKREDGEFVLFEALKKPGIYEVDATGLGCALISRDILEKVYFSDRYDKNGMIYRTDDLDFCEQVQYLGHKVYLDFGCQCDHLVTKGISLLNIMRGNNDQ